MARVVSKLQKQFKDILEKAVKEGEKAAMNVAHIENESKGALVKRISDANAKAFAEAAAQPLAKAIDDYITSQTFVHVLSNAAGTVTGKITST